MLLPQIRLLIVDLDNTLYDWVKFFVPAFYGMVEAASRILYVDAEILLDDLKIVHQRYHSSERPYALLETQIVSEKLPNTTPLEKRELLKDAFDEFNRIRSQTLILYPGVRETLIQVHRSGCKIVGYTEAPIINSLHRMKLLGLLDLVHCLYAPDSPDWQHPDASRRSITDGLDEKIRLLPYGHRKPAPLVLEDICSEQNNYKEETLYVGDSLTRDVSMALIAGVHSAWAKYGTHHDAESWRKLVRVTHWTDADVKREDTLKRKFQRIKPEIELQAFSDILNHFEFTDVKSENEIA